MALEGPDAIAVVRATNGDTKPLKAVPVALGTVTEKLPATEGKQTVAVTAQIDVPMTGNYTVHAGFEDSTHNVVTLDGKEVYRKEVGGKPAVAKVAIKAGNRYPVTVTYFKGGSAAFWLAFSAASTVVLPASAALICWPTAIPMDWNSGMAANCTPVYGLLGSVLSFGLADSMAFSSAEAKRAAFWKSASARSAATNTSR